MDNLKAKVLATYNWLWGIAPPWRRYLVVGIAGLLAGVTASTCAYAGVVLDPCPDRIAVPDAPTAATGGNTAPFEPQERYTVGEADERCQRKEKFCKEAK